MIYEFVFVDIVEVGNQAPYRNSHWMEDICLKRFLIALLLPTEDHLHCLWNDLMENWNNSSSIAPSLRVGHLPITKFHRIFGLSPRTIVGQSLPLLNLSWQ